MTAGTARGALAIFHGTLPGYLAAVEAWYDEEHHDERLAVPGFLRAARFRRPAVARRPVRLFNLYETASPAVFDGPAYRARLDSPTERTRRAMPLFIDFSRTICRIDTDVGDDSGAAIWIVAYRGEPRPSPVALDEALAAAMGLGPSARRALRLTNVMASALETAETRLRGGADTSFEAALLIAADDAGQARQAGRRAAGILAAFRGAEVETGIFHRVFTRTNAAPPGQPADFHR